MSSNQHRLQIPIYDPDTDAISPKAWINLVDLGKQAAGKMRLALLTTGLMKSLLHMQFYYLEARQPPGCQILLRTKMTVLKHGAVSRKNSVTDFVRNIPYLKKQSLFQTSPCQVQRV